MTDSSRGKQLIAAIVVFLVAIGLNKIYLDGEIQRRSPGEFKQIVIVKKQIAAGAQLAQGMLEPAKVPVNFMPKTAVPWNDVQQYIGQEVTVTIGAGDYLLETYFDTRQAIGKTLSQQIEGDNFRAINLPVDETNSLARSIVTGDHIDIVLTFNAPGVGTKVSLVLLQNVPVIATGTYSVVDEELGARGARVKRYNSLTLALTADDAFRLNYGRQVGKVSILLRNNKDLNTVDFKPVAGIQDILLPADKEMIQRLVSQAGHGQDKERMQEQIKQMFDANKAQSRGR